MESTHCLRAQHVLVSSQGSHRTVMFDLGAQVLIRIEFALSLCLSINMHVYNISREATLQASYLTKEMGAKHDTPQRSGKARQKNAQLSLRGFHRTTESIKLLQSI